MLTFLGLFVALWREITSTPPSFVTVLIRAAVYEFEEREGEENTPRSAGGLLGSRRRASPRAVNSPTSLEIAARANKRRAIEKTTPAKPATEVTEVIAQALHSQGCFPAGWLSGVRQGLVLGSPARKPWLVGRVFGTPSLLSSPARRDALPSDEGSANGDDDMV